MGNNVEAEIVNDIDVTSTGDIDVCVEDSSELEVTVNKREFNVVGDELYIPALYEDAPAWMQNLIDQTVRTSIEVATGDLDEATKSLNELILELEVAKNTYTQSIISSNDIDQRINTAITTLNSELAGADATILDIAQTAVTPDEATAISVDAIGAELENDEVGSLGAVVGQLNQSRVDGDEANATSIDTLFSTLETADENIEANASAINTLDTYVGISEGSADGTGLLADVEILQKQNDGIIETTTGTYDVMLNAEASPVDDDELVVTAEPYASWLAEDVSNGNEDVRLTHIGDVYIKYQLNVNGTREYVASYKFIKTDVDGSSPYSTDAEGYTWAVVVDQAAQDAYTAALDAYDLADDKRRVFVAEPVGPYDEGDLWVDDSSGSRIVRTSEASRATGYDANDWVIADEQTIEFANIVNPKISTLQNQVDGKIEYYYYDNSTNNPLATISAGWGENEHGNVVYYKETDEGWWYNGKLDTFEALTDTSMLASLQAAEDAQSTADGKITLYSVYKQATAPDTEELWLDDSSGLVLKEYTTAWVPVIGIKEGDLAYVENPTSDDVNVPYRYDGTSWTFTRDGKVVSNASAITDLETYTSMNGNTAGGSTTLLQDLNTEIDNNNTTVTSKFEYNSLLTVNGLPTTAGFGLVNELSSVNGAPPAGESEFWINADKFKFTNTANTGASATPFSIDASGTVPEVKFNGKVEFASVENTPGRNSNLLYNSAPKAGYETDGWAVGLNNHGLPDTVIGAGYAPFIPTGGASVYITVPGEPVSGQWFDLDALNSFGELYIPVFSGVRYEASAYVSAHRCTAYLMVRWYDLNGDYITQHGGSAVTTPSSGPLTNWDRSVLFATAPANAASARLYVRGFITETEPYMFVTHAFMGIATDTQTEFSPWTEGVSHASSANDVVAEINDGTTTKIDGGRLTTGSVTALQIDTTDLIAENIYSDTISGKTITGATITGAVIEGSVIRASYLDLDGELLLFTDYVITVADYNANPSLYIDATLDEGANNYRIPTLSNPSEEVLSATLAQNQSLFGTLAAYSIANVRHNRKSKTLTPVFDIKGDTQLFYGEGTEFIGYNDYPGSGNVPEFYFNIPPPEKLDRGIYVRVLLGGTLIATCGIFKAYATEYVGAYIRDEVNDVAQGHIAGYGVDGTLTQTTEIGTMEIDYYVRYGGFTGYGNFTLRLKAGTKSSAVAWNSTSGLEINLVSPTTNTTSTLASLGTSISLTNT